jgi:hypothetical protein
MNATRETAGALWGDPVVTLALAEATHEPMTAALARTVAEVARAGDDVSFARWALALPWPRFCAVVRLCAGVTRADLLE